MPHNGDRIASISHYKVWSPRKRAMRGADQPEDIQIGDSRAQISKYRVWSPKNLARRGADETLDERDIPALENPEAWKIWKNMLLTNQPQMQEFGSQLAVYMHCMLQ